MNGAKVLYTDQPVVKESLEILVDGVLVLVNEARDIVAVCVLTAKHVSIYSKTCVRSVYVHAYMLPVVNKPMFDKQSRTCFQHT